MKSSRYTFLILFISWTCFVIGCAVSAAYLNVSSQYEAQASEAVEAMQLRDSTTRSTADATDMEIASAKQFMQEYYRYLQAGNREKLLELVEDKDSFYTFRELEHMTSYIEAYQNIRIYVEKADRADSYIVFVSYYTKLYDIDTGVPGVSQYYIQKNGTGWLIYNNSDHLSLKAQKAMKASLRITEIKTLIETTNRAYQQALGENDKLKEYFEESH